MGAGIGDDEALGIGEGETTGDGPCPLHPTGTNAKANAATFEITRRCYKVHMRFELVLRASSATPILLAC